MHRIGPTPAVANLVPGLIPRRWAGAPAPYRGSTYLSRGPWLDAAGADGYGRRWSLRRARKDRRSSRRASSEALRELAGPRQPQQVAVALTDDVEFGLGVKHADLLPRPQDDRAARDLPSGAHSGFILMACNSLPSPMPSSSPAAERGRGRLGGSSSRVSPATCSRSPGRRSAPTRRLGGGLPGGLHAHLPAPRQAARRRGHSALDRPAHPPLCIDHLRSSAREEIVDPDTMPGGVDDAMATIDEAFAVHEAMSELSENCREILDRFFARDESYQMIGPRWRSRRGRSPAVSPAASPASGRSSRKKPAPGASS